MTASHIFTLPLLILLAAPATSAGDQRITSAQFDRHHDAISRFQTTLATYVAQRYQIIEPASEETFCLPDDGEGGEAAWTPYEGAFFFPAISRIIRQRAGAALHEQYKHVDLSLTMKREALLAPAIQVNEALPRDAGKAAPPWLAAVLPELPKELAYRQVGVDLALIDAASNHVIDVLRCAFLLP
ncbi:MAG TPA: hypothetical protein VFV95_00345 [Vicinamibacterales bacterium]|nr:hypothetical protein [Vicinamibacterales bacterium]